MYLIIERNMRAEFADWQRSLLRMTAFSSIVLGIAILLIWSLVRRFSRSLSDVTQVAVDVSEGDFTRKLEVSRNDELGILFEAFNEMTDKLKASYENLKQVNR